MVLGAMVGAAREVFGKSEKEKKEIINELKWSIFASWEDIDKNVILISNEDERQVKVMVHAMKDIKRLERIAGIVGKLFDQVNIYKLASSRASRVLEKEQVKNTAQQKIKQYIQELNSFLSINLTFRDGGN